MCMSTPKAPKPPKPVPLPVNLGPEIIDDQALREREREREKQRRRYGRASTILAGKTASGNAAPTGASKTALGS